MARLITTDQVKLFTKGSQTHFMRAFETYDSYGFQVADRVPSSQETEHYPHVGSHPIPREWLGTRAEKSFKTYTYSVINKDWEVTWKVDRKAYIYDQYGVVTKLATGGGYAMAQYLEQLTATQVANSMASGYLCYDGQIMCSASHPIGDTGSTDSNKGTAALSPTAVAAAVAEMMMFPDDNGRPLGIVPDKLIVGPSLRDTALKLAGSPYDPTNANSELNTNAFLDVVVWPWVESEGNAAYWFLACTKRAFKPVFWQEVQGPSPVRIIEDKLDTDKFHLYGSDMIGNMGYGDWRCLYGSSGGA